MRTSHTEPHRTLKTLGAQAARLVAELHERARTVITISDVEKITGLSSRSARSFAGSLVRRGGGDPARTRALHSGPVRPGPRRPSGHRHGASGVLSPHGPTATVIHSLEITVKKKRARSSRKRSYEERWSDLTWADLNDWAGSRAVTRGRSYQRRGSVHELGMSPEGELVAWVVGGSRYATRVRCAPPRPGSPGPSRLKSSCSCPVGTRCKHAVAIVVEALESLEAGKEIQQVMTDDVRWDIATGVFEVAGPEAVSEPSSLEPYLRSLKKAQLVELILQVSAVHPEVEADIVHRRALSGDDVAAIVRRIRAEIATVSAQEAWSNSWSGEGDIPDYSRVESGLESLLDGAHHDAVVELGRELFDAGQDQVGRSHDDGETCMAIADCMFIVFRAVLRSSLSDPKKILYAIDLSLADEYGLADNVEPWYPKTRTPWMLATFATRLYGPPPRCQDRCRRPPARQAHSDPYGISFSQLSARRGGSHRRRHQVLSFLDFDAHRPSPHSVIPSPVLLVSVCQGLPRVGRSPFRRHPAEHQ